MSIDLQNDLVEPNPVQLVCKDGRTITFINSREGILALYNESLFHKRLSTAASTLFVERSNRVIEVVNKQTYIQVRWFDDLFGSYQKQKADRETECQ